MLLQTGICFILHIFSCMVRLLVSLLLGVLDSSSPFLSLSGRAALWLQGVVCLSQSCQGSELQFNQSAQPQMIYRLKEKLVGMRASAFKTADSGLTSLSRK